MAGLVPAINVLFGYIGGARRLDLFHDQSTQWHFVSGVTSNLPRRAFEHRDGLLDGFTKRYGLKRLIYFERFDDIRHAIQREKSIKRWPRAWKVRLTHSLNPEWDDLYEMLI